MQSYTKFIKYFGVLSGLFLGVAWPHSGGLFPIIFISFVPLLLFEKYIYDRKYKPYKVFGQAFIGFLIFNFITSWWISLAYDPNGSQGEFYTGLIAGIATNITYATIMALTFYLYHIIRRNTSKNMHFSAFVFIWIGFEFAHYYWDLSHPWLTLGNVFANNISFIQWYEFTGVLGGSFWILTINFLIFRTITSQRKRLKWIGTASVFLVPIIISLILKFNNSFLNSKQGKNYEVIITQPNIDAYQKYGSSLSPKTQLDRILNPTDSLITENTELIIAPETALTQNINEENINNSILVLQINQFLERHPQVALLVGASTYRFFDKKHSAASRKNSNGEFYESYNSALLFKHGEEVQIYHKSKLVIGVERVPFKWITKYFENFAIDLGGTTGTLGIEKEAKLLVQNDINISPEICYESIYGGYSREFTKKGANLMAIITNDGWWRNSPGHLQHLAYARIRAIENRRYIVRSANTGISAVIDPNGHILQNTKWDELTAFKANIHLLNRKTFYVKYGDYIGRFSLFVAIILIVIAIVQKIKGTSI